VFGELAVVFEEATAVAEIVVDLFPAFVLFVVPFEITVAFDACAAAIVTFAVVFVKFVGLVVLVAFVVLLGCVTLFVAFVLLDVVFVTLFEGVDMSVRLVPLVVLVLFIEFPSKVKLKVVVFPKELALLKD